MSLACLSPPCREVQEVKGVQEVLPSHPLSMGTTTLPSTSTSTSMVTRLHMTEVPRSPGCLEAIATQENLSTEKLGNPGDDNAPR